MNRLTHAEYEFLLMVRSKGVIALPFQNNTDISTPDMRLAQSLTAAKLLERKDNSGSPTRILSFSLLRAGQLAIEDYEKELLEFSAKREALQLAEEANRISKEANTISSQAVLKSETANIIAQSANKESKKSNWLSIASIIFSALLGFAAVLVAALT